MRRDYDALSQSVQGLQKNNKKLQAVAKILGKKQDTSDFRHKAQNNLRVTRNLISDLDRRFQDLEYEHGNNSHSPTQQ